MKKSLGLISIILALVLFANSVYADGDWSSDMAATELFPAGDHEAVAVDRWAGKVALADLAGNQWTNLLDDTFPVLDVEVTNHPDKIVVLKKIGRSKIGKIVFSYRGAILSKTEIPLSLEIGDQAKWVAPSGKTNERIMVRKGNDFKLYQYPWKKASVSYNAEWIDRGYDSVNVIDWDFKGYPYLAIQYDASGIMSDHYWLKTVNLYTRKEAAFKDFNTRFKLALRGGNALLLTSNVYGSVYQPMPPNMLRPKASDSQPYFQTVTFDQGIKRTVLHGIFKDDGNLGGWQTQLAGNRLFVGDLGKRTWSLYSEKGEPIVTGQVWSAVGSSHFADYDPSSKTAYFLEYHSGKASIAAYPVK